MTTADAKIDTEGDEEELAPAPQWVKPLPPGVPPTAFWGADDKLYHRIEVVSEGGSKHIAERGLAQTLEEARDNRLDYFHPTLGLIWEGYKLAKDRTPEDRARDSSQSRIRPGATLPTS